MDGRGAGPATAGGRVSRPRAPGRLVAGLPFLLLFLASGLRAQDGYPRHPVTPELRTLMTSGLPESMQTALNVRVGDPLPRHIVHYEDQVRWLVDHIDERPEYADHLKYGYFLRRWPGQWPAGQALRLIEVRLNAEEQAGLLHDAATHETALPRTFRPTRAWLRLASVAAFATAARNRPEGWRGAYARLWTNVDALKAHPEVFLSVVQDYTGEAARGSPPSEGSASASATLVKDFDAWFPAWLAMAQGFPHEPALGFFLHRFGLTERAANFVAAQREAGPASFVFLNRAASAFSGAPPAEQAGGEAPAPEIGLLAAAIAGPDFAAQDAALRRQAYQEWVARLSAAGRWDEALDALRRARAEGLASPLSIALKAYQAAQALERNRPPAAVDVTAPPSEEARDTAAAIGRYRQWSEEALAEAMAEDGPREDVIDRAGLLLALGRPAKAEAALLDLLNAEKTDRDLIWYTAALRLAQLYHRGGRGEPALRWLAECENAPLRPSPATIALYAESRALKQRLLEVTGKATPEAPASSRPKGDGK